jgi:hypothetical protein
LRFYEIRVPGGIDPAEIIEVHGIGVFPSADPRDEDGQWFVALLSRDGIELALDLGLDVQRARRVALRPEELAAFEAEGATVDDRAELVAAGLVEPMAPSPGCDDILEVFCRYRNEDPDNDLCNTTSSITSELQALAAAYPGFARFVQITDLTTFEGRRLVGLRVGTQQGTNVPQLLVFGAQHSNEWAASGLVLALARRLAALSVGDPLRTELQTRAVLFVPVANPDGYAHTFTGELGGSERNWRPNRNPCTGDIGIDPNRNFPFSWHPNIFYCGDRRYGGAAPGDQAETTLLNRMFLNSGLYNPPQATYATRFFLNYHAYGNYILFPDGLTDAADGESGLPCREPNDEYTYPAYNCEPPDFAALRWMAGSEAEPKLRDEVKNHPYSSDTVWRTLYGVDGDQMSHHAFSHTIEDFDPELDRRSLGVALEVTGSSVGFTAECMTLTQWNTLVDRHWSFLGSMIQNLDEVSSEANLVAVPALGTRTGRRIHRLRSDDDQTPTTDYGPPRFWIDQRQSLPQPTITTPTGFEGEADGWAAAGLFYRTWRWTPNTPYLFPPWFTACQGQQCDIIDTEGSTDLCSSDLFETTTGWQFTDQTGVNQDDCYFELTGRGTGPFVLQRIPRNMPNADQVHLNYSYRMDYEAFGAWGRVEVAVRWVGGSWVRVRTYPLSRVGDHVSGYPAQDSSGMTALRTELVDLPPEFDRRSNIQVRFRAYTVGTPIPSSGFAFRVYDVILIGRHVE